MSSFRRFDKIAVMLFDAKTGPSTVDQPGDQARRVPTELIHQQVCHIRVVMQRQVTHIQTANKLSINQGTKHAVFSQIQYIDKVIVDMRVVMHRPVPLIQTVSKTVKVLSAQFVGTVVDVLVIMQIDQVTKGVEILQTKYIVRVAAMLVMQQQAPQFQTQTSAKIAEVPPAKFAGQLWMCPRRSRRVDGTTDHSASDCAEDRESPAGAAHERLYVQIADVPVPHAALNERISERMHEQIVDVPVPQKIKENVEPGSRESAACGGATTCSSASNCGKTIFPSIKQGTKHAYFPQYIDKIVDMLVVMQRMVPRIQTSWKTVEVPAQFVGTVVVVSVIMLITQTRRNSTWSSRLSHRKAWLQW